MIALLTFSKREKTSYNVFYCLPFNSTVNFVFLGVTVITKTVESSQSPIKKKEKLFAK